jgi:serine/threonine-protein kinase
MAATTDVITLRCPECRVPIPVEQGPRCPTHDLYGLDAATLTHLVDHPLLGQVLDEKYALVGVLGRGGTGSVYRGLQEPLGRPVGVKLLHSAFLAGREGRERFEREARALASLTSLHTVRLLDYGITRQGPAALRNIAYLVMELLEGEDLEARLARGPLAPVDVLAVLDALADSLDEAHAAGIVHRDLKPSNVVLTRRRDGREVPKLIDFGIARMEGGSLTEQGRVSGTPFFMAPEQARGDEAQGTAADVYGAGALCFTLLTGRVPFSGPNAAAIMMAHVRDAVPPLDPSGTDPVLARLEPVIHAAMAKDGAARPASVGGLRDAFAAALGVTGAVTVADAGSASPRPVAPPAPETPVARSWSRAPWVWGAAVAALALTAVFAIATRPSPPPEAAFGVVQPAVPASAAPTVAPRPRRKHRGRAGFP